MDDHPARTSNQGVVDAGGPGPMVLSNAVAMGRLVVPCTQGLLAKRFFFRQNKRFSVRAVFFLDITRGVEVSRNWNMSQRLE